MLRAEGMRQEGLGGNWGWKETEEFGEDSGERKRIAGTGGTARWKEGVSFLCILPMQPFSSTST